MTPTTASLSANRGTSVGSARPLRSASTLWGRASVRTPIGPDGRSRFSVPSIPIPPWARMLAAPARTILEGAAPIHRDGEAVGRRGPRSSERSTWNLATVSWRPARRRVTASSCSTRDRPQRHRGLSIAPVRPHSLEPTREGVLGRCRRCLCLINDVTAIIPNSSFSERCLTSSLTLRRPRSRRSDEDQEPTPTRFADPGLRARGGASVRGSRSHSGVRAGATWLAVPRGTLQLRGLLPRKKGPLSRPGSRSDAGIQLLGCDLRRPAVVRLLGRAGAIAAG